MSVLPKSLKIGGAAIIVAAVFATRIENDEARSFIIMLLSVPAAVILANAVMAFASSRQMIHMSPDTRYDSEFTSSLELPDSRFPKA
jgi:hypothetical protein